MHLFRFGPGHFYPVFPERAPFSFSSKLLFWKIAFPNMKALLITGLYGNIFGSNGMVILVIPTRGKKAAA